MQDIIVLTCADCKRKNYTTTKNKKKNPDKLDFKKYCKWCRAQTTHKEAKK